MIIHKLIAEHFRTRDYRGFYRLQAEDAICWLGKQGVVFGPQTHAFDLGCGHGIFGAELLRRGCPTTFADEGKYLFPEIASAPFIEVNLDRDDITKLGRYDLVICSNVLEHLSNPRKFIESIGKVLNPAGWMYLSWTNWLSPWGGHEFSPFHYFGARRGHRIYDRLFRKQRVHTPFENLFPTYIGNMLHLLRSQSDLEVVKAVPRYYTEAAFIMAVPILREFLAWNCAVLLRKRSVSC